MGIPIPIIGPIVRPIGGLAAEAIAHHRRKSSANDESTSRSSRSHSPVASPPAAAPSDSHASTSTSLAPPPYSEQGAAASGSDDEDPEIESDEEQWALDEAAESVTEARGARPPSAVPKGNLATPASVDELVLSFVAHHPPGGPAAGSALTYPVILPQRRPRNQSRGFVRAYAPLLGECGVSQAAWFDFLDSFAESIKVSPIFDAVNAAAGIAGVVPEPTAQIVSFAVQTADIIAKRTYGRVRTNTFLSQINAAFFRPQGLCCLILTYKPEARGAPIATFDLDSTIVRTVQGPDSNWAAVRSRLACSQGTSVGAAQVPRAAPLVYPQLDAASEGEKRSAWKRSAAFVGDYFDRRAQAKNYLKDPAGAFSIRPQFESGWADPSQGGKAAKLESPQHRRKMEKRAAKRARNQGQIKIGPLTPIKLVMRTLKTDMLYMMVAKIPPQEELAAARQLLEIDD